MGVLHPEQRKLLEKTIIAARETAEKAARACGESEPEGWVLAARYASAMPRGIFRPDDRVMQVRVAAEGERARERLVSDLPAEAFTAADSLGWVYQFWQSRRKKEVNES